MTHPTEQRLERRVERLSLQFSLDSHGNLSGSLLWIGHLPGDVHLFKCTSILTHESKVSFVVEGQGPLMSFNGIVSADGKIITGFIQGAELNEKFQFVRSGKAPLPKPASVTVTTPPSTPAPSIGELPPASPENADSAELLSKAIEKVKSARRQLVKYTCAETIERSYYGVPQAELGEHLMTKAPGQSCAGRTFGGRSDLILQAEDRVRLEVAVSDGKELDSWASANAFDSRTIHELVSTGPTSTGAFGTTLLEVRTIAFKERRTTRDAYCSLTLSTFQGRSATTVCTQGSNGKSRRSTACSISTPRPPG